MSNPANRRIVLASRPFGAPTSGNFCIETQPIPIPAQGQMLLRTVYLSLDPYMRGRMSDAPSYAPPVEIGSVMVGSTISRVELSHHPEFAVGDWVLSQGGWQEYSLSDGAGVFNLGAQMGHPSLALGVLGMPGFTAYMGLLDIGQPKAGETVVVAAASGAVGSVVGQIAKLKGCRVAGLAGGAEKCRYVTQELGFDACLDHRGSALKERLAQACPDGIDVYFESVGGAVFDAVLPLLNARARIPLCGLIAHYNDKEAPLGRDRTAQVMGAFLKRRVRVQGFIIFDDYGPRFGEFQKQMGEWFAAGKIKYREDIVEGLERAPEAFMGLLEGKNFGKLVVRVSAETEESTAPALKR
jgi:NADPH-dependent curcumin reductase CurA